MPGSSTASPLANGASASRIELAAAARSSSRLAFQRAADRADLERALHRAIEATAHGCVEQQRARLHFDSCKAGLAQDAADARLRGERKRPGIFRPLLRQFWHVLVGRLQRRHEKRIFARLAPAGERQPARRPQRLAHIRKRQHRIGEEHHAEARGQQVETCGLEGIDGGIRQSEIDRQVLWCACPRPRQHRARDVDTERVT